MGKKRLISLLVSMVMIVAMFPAIVSADDEINSFAAIQAAIDEAAVGTPVAVQIAADCVAGEDDTCIVIPSGKTVAIFLNGHTIDRGLTYADGPSADGHVIKVENGGTLYINPNGGTGIITGGYAVNGGGIYVEFGGALKMNDSTITANRASQNGGGIYFEENPAGADGKINVNEFFGGTINNNMATNGGGIFVGVGADTVYFKNGQTNGATITGNRAALGGGMYIAGRVSAEKLSVTSNLATSHGGGVYFGQYGHYELRGKNVVKSNRAGADGSSIDEDVYLPTGKTIEVMTSGLTGSEIGVAVEDTSSEVTFTTGFSNAGVQIDPNTYFFSNDSEKEIALDTETNEAILKSTGGQQEIVSFAGSSLTLDDGRIGLNVYVDFGPLTDNETAESVAKVEFTVPGRGAKTEIDECDANHKVTAGSKTYYMFTCYLSSLQMAEEVNAKFMIGDDSIEETFSISGYIKRYQYFRTHPEEAPDPSVFMGENSVESYLVEALANYGYFLQPWLSSLNGWEIGGEDGYAQMENIYGTNPYTNNTQGYRTAISNALRDEYSALAVIDKSYGISKVSFKLELESTNALIVTFHMDTAVTDKLSVTCEYNGKTYKAYKKETDNGVDYVIRISGIRIQDMDDEFTVKGIAGTEATEENVNVVIKPIGYVYYGLNNKLTNNQKFNALSALFYYWLRAYDYAAAQ